MGWEWVEKSMTGRQKITFHAIIGKALTEFIHHNEDNTQWIVGATDFLGNKKTLVQPWTIYPYLDHYTVSQQKKNIYVTMIDPAKQWSLLFMKQPVSY